MFPFNPIETGEDGFVGIGVEEIGLDPRWSVLALANEVKANLHGCFDSDGGMELESKLDTAMAVWLVFILEGSGK